MFAVIPMQGLDSNGQMFLRLTMMIIVFGLLILRIWDIFQVFHLTLLVIFGGRTVCRIFTVNWRSTYLIASAVKNSGLGKRIAMFVISKYITNLKSWSWRRKQTLLN